MIFDRCVFTGNLTLFFNITGVGIIIGAVVVWRKRNRTTQKYNLYKVSTKAKHLIARIYRMMLGEEEIPEGTSNKIMQRLTYSDKVLATAITKMNKDIRHNYGLQTERVSSTYKYNK